MNPLYADLTPEQIEIVKPVLSDLDERFFDMAGRLDETYLGEFKLEAFKAALFLHEEKDVPQFTTYKYIRQYALKVSNLDVLEEYNIINNAVIFGIHLLKKELKISSQVS